MVVGSNGNGSRLRAGASAVALDHAAVEQQLAARHPQDVAGARHFAGGSEKLQLHAGHTLTSRHPEHSGARHERSVARGFRPPHFPHRGVAAGVIGGGLVLGIRFANRREAAAPGGAGRTLAPNAFVRVAPDDTVTVVIGKSEMGQGIYTGLAMALAEELDVDPARVTVEFAGADPAFNVPFMPIQFTGGSMSTSTTYMQLREAGARARAMLLAAAAQKWNVDAAALRTEDGKVSDGAKSAELRRARRRGLAASRAGKGDAQGSGAFPLSRQAAQAARRAA